MNTSSNPVQITPPRPLTILTPAVPHDVSEAAAALGRRSKGKAKEITPEDSERRRQQIMRVNEMRRAGTTMSGGTLKKKMETAAPGTVTVSSGTLVKKLPPRQQGAKWKSTTIYAG